MPCGGETELLTVPLELGRKLRLGHRVSELWRDEFDEWRAFPPYDLRPSKQKDAPVVPLDLDERTDVIGAGIERMILHNLLSRSSLRNTDAAASRSNVNNSHCVSDRDMNSVRDEHLLRRRLVRILRSLNRPYSLAQRAAQREHAKLPVAPLRGGVVSRSIANFTRSFAQGWRQAIAMYFSPLTALRRALRRRLSRFRNRPL